MNRSGSRPTDLETVVANVPHGDHGSHAASNQKLAEERLGFGERRVLLADAMR